MKDTATVQSVEGEMVKLICGANEACRSCKANSLCSSKSREVSAVNRKGLSISKGDTVEIFIPPGKTIFAGFVVLIFPLLTFILAFVVAGRLFPGVGEGLQALAGLGGLAAGFSLSFLYNGLTKKKNVPIITRRVESPVDAQIDTAAGAPVETPHEQRQHEQ
jgi:sigma-E factor negative regulatory protein RseC